MKGFKWKKLGLVYQQINDKYTHASHPCIIHYKEDIFVICFTSRDLNKKSNIFISYVRIVSDNIQFLTEPKMIIGPGDIGCFDCDGTISCCLVKDNNKCYLYYVGWQNLPNEMWICDTGRAIVNLDDLSAYKEYEGPIFGRDKDHPLFVAATAFFITPDKIWHTWYNTGIKWELKDEGVKHYYGIHHATSLDGVNWTPDNPRIMTIPFKDEYEYAFGRPSVVFWNNQYHMWFAHRASKEIDKYRMGYACSIDGINWVRNDDYSGINVSDKGWDSDMICYPCVFEYDNKKYMLYNGNNYGETGFGLAILEK